jgi:hypothetical protein
MIEGVSLESFPSDYEEPAPLSETIGKGLWGASAIITAVGSIDYACKKKRKKRSVVPLSAPITPMPSFPITPLPALERLPSTQIPARMSAAPETPNAFEELPYSQDDQDQIRFVVETLKKGEYISKAGQLMAAGDKIEARPDPIHPFRFLWTIFSQRDLKQDMRTVMAGWVTRKGFMTGVDRGMNREMKKGNIEQYIDGFAASLKLDAKELKPLILEGAPRKDWRKLVDHLLEKARAHGE